MARTNLPALITQSESRIAEVLPEGMDPRRVVRLGRLAVHRTPALLKCDPVSVIEAILQASQLGLEIASPIGGAHLVPYKGKCQMIPDYRALIRMALKCGACETLVAREVYAVDHFEISQGSNERIIHIPSITDEAREDDDIIAFYAVAGIKGGRSVHEWAPRGDVDKIRDRSPAGKNGPWVTDYAAMGKKTLVKRLMKWLDISTDLGRAIELDNRYETGGEATGLLPDDDDSAAQMAAATAQAQDEMTAKLEEARRAAEAKEAEMQGAAQGEGAEGEDQEGFGF